MSDSGRYDPDERFSLYPLDPEEGLRRLLDPDKDDDAVDETEGAEEP